MLDVEWLEDANAPCYDELGSWRAEVALRGSVQGRRIAERISLRYRHNLARVDIRHRPGQLTAALGADGSTPDRLVLPASNRVLDAPSGAIAAHLFGMRISADEIRGLLGGCYMPEPIVGMVMHGRHWRRVPFGPPGPERPGGDLYYFRQSASEPWRMVTMLFMSYPGRESPSRWRLDYRDEHEGRPHTLRIRSAVPQAFDVEMTVERFEKQDPFPYRIFHPPVPASARRLTLDQLTAADIFGSLAENGP